MRPTTPLDKADIACYDSHDTHAILLYVDLIVQASTLRQGV